MIQALQTLSRIGLAITDGTAAPSRTLYGTPLESDGSLAIDTVGAISYYNTGAPLTINGRICASIDMAVDYFSKGALPLTSDERVAFSNSAGVGVAGGILYDEQGRISTIFAPAPPVEGGFNIWQTFNNWG